MATADSSMIRAEPEKQWCRETTVLSFSGSMAAIEAMAMTTLSVVMTWYDYSLEGQCPLVEEEQKLEV